MREEEHKANVELIKLTRSHKVAPTSIGRIMHEVLEGEISTGYFSAAILIAAENKQPQEQRYEVKDPVKICSLLSLPTKLELIKLIKDEDITGD